MDDIKAKQQVVDKIKEATSILVTVSDSPSVDALSAALGLALLIDKLDKHATAVFSGAVPPAITFLEPEKTFEQNTSSLRDFIIALDKEKADHLRLKVEGDVAKIFITPYRTTITSDDLSFSEGDFNVELVIALGVDSQDHLDNAMDSHGQILHDAPVITITAGEQTSNLGGIDWHDSRASSLSEMITGLGEALKDKERLSDKQIATALLTGIVAATDRFSNPHTTSAAMTVAAQLMADGADQQLIAAELEKPHEASAKPQQDKPVKVKKVADAPKDTNSMNIVHGETLAEMDKRVKAEEAVEDAREAAEQKKPAPKPETKEPKEIKEEKEEAPKDGEIGDVHAKADSPLSHDEPTLGGTLNATTDQAEEDSRRELDSDKNKTILTHSYVGGSDTPAMSGATAGEDNDSASVDPLSSAANDAAKDEVHSSYAPEPEAEAPAPAPVLEPKPELVVEPPKQPEPTPIDLGLPMPPPLPDFSGAGGLNEAYAPEPLPEHLGDILPPLDAPQPPTPPTPPTQPPSNDPGQFKIPGQQ
jgi:nanoRNase/pAp phosphatase (c-di-AMP/oligoRNAs hydrolase)